MHAYLLKLDCDTWAFLQEHSKRNGRTVAGTIRMLVADLREKELYGENGFLEDLPFPENAKGEPSAFWALDIGERVEHVRYGKGTVVTKDIQDESFAVRFDKDPYTVWFSWEENWKEFCEEEV